MQSRPPRRAKKSYYCSFNKNSSSKIWHSGFTTGEIGRKLHASRFTLHVAICHRRGLCKNYSERCDRTISEGRYRRPPLASSEISWRLPYPVGNPGRRERNRSNALYARREDGSWKNSVKCQVSSVKSEE